MNNTVTKLTTQYTIYGMYIIYIYIIIIIEIQVYIHNRK